MFDMGRGEKNLFAIITDNSGGQFSIQKKKKKKNSGGQYQESPFHNNRGDLLSMRERPHHKKNK